MKRIFLPERPDWKQQAEALGFGFHSMYGAPYWDESWAYEFTLREIEEDLEDPSEALWRMCLELVGHVVADPALMTRMAIPEAYHSWITESWSRGDPALYGRFDFHYDGTAPAKLLEFNADTPTALYETGFFQWLWLEDQIRTAVLPADADQFNALQDQLIARFQALFAPGSVLHFASVQGNDEERATVQYLQDCAQQAGLRTPFVAVEDIGVDANGQFADHDSVLIETLFKLYPWEDMLRERFAPHLVGATARFIEPPWKAILSNKACLPLLWEMYPNHPNLLPSWFEGDAPPEATEAPHVLKPLFSREGANVTIKGLGEQSVATDGDYGAEGRIIQAYTPAAKFGEDHAMIGSWIVGDAACGICIREDRALVTQDLSRFVPHFIRG